MNGWQLVATGAVSLVGATVGALVLFQERLLYHPGIPSRAHAGSPADYGISFSDVPLVAADGTRLHAWLLHAPPPGGGRLGGGGPVGRRRPAGPATVLYFHGNAGNISHRLPDAARWVRDVGAHVLLVSYRGYGLSQGQPTEAGLRQDAQAALDWALAGGGRGGAGGGAPASSGNGGTPGTSATPGSVPAPAIDPSRVFVFGRSLGGAVGLALAAANPPPALAGVIVENTFTSINNMIDVVLPPLRWAKRLNRNVWDSAGVVGRLDLPMLFMSGAEDELVPPRMMAALYEGATAGGWGRKKMVVIAGGTHNDTWYVGGDAYYGAIREFVERAASSAASAASTAGGGGGRRLGGGGGQRLGGGGGGQPTRWGGWGALSPYRGDAAAAQGGAVAAAYSMGDRPRWVGRGMIGSTPRSRTIPVIGRGRVWPRYPRG